MPSNRRAPSVAFALLACCLAGGLATSCRSAGVPAPASIGCAALEPLTRAELADVRAILEESGDLAAGGRLVTADLLEPPKDDLERARVAGTVPPRRARAGTFDRHAASTVVVTVDLSTRAVVARRTAEPAQPMIGDDDYRIATALVRADARWQAALTRRGVTDFDAVYLDPWAPGSDPVPNTDGARLSRLLSSFQGRQQNPYGPPIEGVVAVVDLTHERVVEVSDTTVAPISKTSTDFFDARVRGDERGRGHPLSPVQAGGSTAVIRGNCVEWEGWSFTWSFHDREGLVLHDVRCDGRTILHRASISEMWVPYGDSDPNWAWRNAFDEGEYGLGNLAHALEAGREVPLNAQLFPAARGGAGDPAVVALWEQDGGMLWSHDGPATICRRARELAIGFVATVGNYDYVFRWVLGLDGTLRFETDLTGILLTKGSAQQQCGACDAGNDGGEPPEGDERYGTVVADHVVAVNHQHFIALRLDFDVDGRANSVRECDVEPDPDATRAGRNGFVARRTLLASEKAAMRDGDAAKHRSWEVFNPTSRNAQGHQRGYTIVPGATAVPYARKDSRERALANFAEHVLWVTRCHETDECFAAGEFPSQATVPGGLRAYAADDEPLEAQDVVVWYVLGITHVPRPEDYPVMPAVHAGVSFEPTGFFDRNPSLGR